LIHAPHPVVSGDQRFIHDIAFAQFHHQMATTPATGAQWNFRKIRDAPQPDAPGARWRSF